MSAREQVLSRVRSALGRMPGQPPPPPPVRLSVPAIGVAEKLSFFCTALEKLAAHPFVAGSPESAREYITQIVGDRPAIASNSAVLRECGVSFSPIEVSKAEVGITGADFGLADTGSLVVLSASDPRLYSLLPPVHIAVLRTCDLLSGLDELLTTLPHPAEQSASMVFITGTSRTADIEQILVRGVHGPGEVHVVLLQ